MLTKAKPDQVVELYESSADEGESRAVFKCLDLRERRFSRLTLLCSDWVECDLRGSVFVDCDLRGASFVDSELSNVVFERCAMYGCDLPNNPSIKLLDCVEVL